MGPEGQQMEGGAPEGGTPDNGGLDSGLYPGIENVPMEYRQHLDPILKEINTNANKRISEVNSKYETWKPYEELGVHERIDPESMQNVLGLLDIINQAEEGDTSQFKDWWETVGNEYGLTAQEEEEIGGDFEDEEGALSVDELKELMSEQLQEIAAPILQQQQDMEQQKLLSSAEEKLDSEIAEVKSEFGDFDEEVERKICQLAMNYDGEGAFRKGFEDYKSIVEGAKGELFAKAIQQPQTPEGPGTPNTAPQSITNFKDATAAAKAALEATANS